MKIYFNLLPFGTIFMVGFNSCHKCQGKQYATQTFSQQELEVIPYTGKEKLIFKNSNNDSIVFIGVDRISGQSNQFSNDPNGDDAMKYDCFGDYYFSEFNSTTFRYNPKNRTFWVSLMFSNMFRTGNLEKLIVFNISSLNPTVSYSGESFCFSSDSIFNSTSFPYNKVIAYYDSYQLGNIFYQRVYKLGCKSGNYLFYTMEDGLVGFVSAEYNLYTLLQK
jgi:hypothetical protein